MSLAIKLESIKAILLADGWHKVSQEGDKFTDIDSYEFIEGDSDRSTSVRLPGGAENLISSRGMTWFDDKEKVWYACPLSSVLAVKFIDE